MKTATRYLSPDEVSLVCIETIFVFLFQSIGIRLSVRCNIERNQTGGGCTVNGKCFISYQSTCVCFLSAQGTFQFNVCRRPIVFCLFLTRRHPYGKHMLWVQNFSFMYCGDNCRSHCHLTMDCLLQLQILGNGNRPVLNLPGSSFARFPSWQSASK